ncbi:MAG: MarR family transcriptional regulator [Firmicutes bacterium]|nr:MarR family transcriptional regulator [Bacillota bacterium]
MAIDRDSDSLTERLVNAFWQFWQQWRQAAHPVRKGKITPEQYWLLKRLKRTGPANVSDLAEGLGITNSSVTAATKRLEKMGLVARRRKIEDERVVEVSLTEAGQAVLEQWASEKRQAMAALLAPLSLEDRALLLELLKKLLKRV